MKILKKITQILLWLLLIILVTYSGFILIQKVILKKEVPSIFGYKNFIVLTNSMVPTLNAGDIVFTKETDNIKENDIIAYQVDGVVVTHRVNHIVEENGKNYYITKGDANSSEDIELISIQDIEGKYIFKIPYLGKVILFLQKPQGIMIFVLIIGTLLLISNKKDEKKEESTNEDKQKH